MKYKSCSSRINVGVEGGDVGDATASPSKFGSIRFRQMLLDLGKIEAKFRKIRANVKEIRANFTLT